MTSRLTTVDYSRQTITGRGEKARAWFATWGASVDPTPSLRLHADTIAGPGLQIARVWHTATRLTLPRGGPATALLPLEGRLRIESGDHVVGELAGDVFGISGGDVDHVLVADAPASWIGIRTDQPLGADLIGPDEALVLEDLDEFTAIAVQMINTTLDRPAPPSPTALARLHQLVGEVIDGAAISARDRDVYQATGMVIAQTRTTPAQALDLIRAHADTHTMTVKDVAAEILARRLTLGDGEPTGRP